MQSGHRFAMAWATLLLAGCARHVYQIEIIPEDGAFRRVVTCWEERGHDPPEVAPLPEEQLQRLEAIYGKPQTVEDGKRRFEGRFQDATPNDVGGAGSYTHWTTSLGSFSYYVERFRGEDDLEADLAPRREAADTLTDLVVGWAEAELAEQPGFDGLRDFLDRKLRRDLTNLGVYTWQAEAARIYEEQAGDEFVARVVQYLVERDYLGPRDLPAIYAAVTGDDFRPLAGLVQRVVVRELGADEPVPESLGWLGDAERLKASFEEYVRTTDLYQQRLAEWRREHADDPEQEPPEPADVIAQLGDQLFAHFEAPGAGAVVEVTLATQVEPFATNGQWNAQAGRVHWSRRLASHRALPSVCFAAWSRPDEEAQRKHFGKVVLDDAELAQYVLWYEALPDEKRPQWDALLERLPTVDDMAGAVRRFRFGGEPEYRPDLPEEQQPESRADEPRRLILHGLADNPVPP